jgi:hypothetical protein
MFLDAIGDTGAPSLDLPLIKMKKIKDGIILMNSVLRSVTKDMLFDLFKNDSGIWNNQTWESENLKFEAYKHKSNFLVSCFLFQLLLSIKS